MMINNLITVLAAKKPDTITAEPIKADGLPDIAANSATMADILGIVFSILGALALLIIVISGLRYILAGGDPQRTAKAKQGIIYALVGLAIAISARAIVAFVVNRL